MNKIIFEDRTQGNSDIDGLCSAISVYATILSNKYKLGIKEYLLILIQASKEMTKYFIKLNLVNEQDVKDINDKAEENSDKFIKLIEKQFYK